MLTCDALSRVAVATDQQISSIARVTYVVSMALALAIGDGAFGGLTIDIVSIVALSAHSIGKVTAIWIKVRV